MDKSDFTKWSRTFQRHILFFDGASKGNLETAGGGGVLFNPNEVLELSYSWGIGEYMNNIVEALSLWQGIYQVLAHDINEISVFVESRLII